MESKKDLFISVSPASERKLEDFFAYLSKTNLNEFYNFSIISDPIFRFRNEFIDEILKNGLTSILKFSVAMDGITSPGMHFDDIKHLVKSYVESLLPARKLLIIDPYFYNKNPTNDTHEYFLELISSFLPDLDEITVISKPTSFQTKEILESKLAASGVCLRSFGSEYFHDRFWINPEKNTGLVMGTSLNGIGRKVALVDRLKTEDVIEILRLVKSETAAI